jgi:hypothetical protein
MDRVDLLILKSLLAVDRAVGNQPNAFHLFGYDVMFDRNGNGNGNGGGGGGGWRGGVERSRGGQESGNSSGSGGNSV